MGFTLSKTLGLNKMKTISLTIKPAEINSRGPPLINQIAVKIGAAELVKSDIEFSCLLI